MHRPVLLQEAISHLAPHPGDFIIDGTVDGGGHAAAILDAVTAAGTLLGVDWDEALLRECKTKIGNHPNVLLAHGSYADLPEILQKKKLPKADGLLLDLGFSSEQLAHSGKGFSFLESAKDEPLIMTYDDSRPTVRDLLRSLSETDLANIIYEFGGERYSRRIAKTIKERGRKNPIRTSGELAAIIREALPKSYEHGRIDPATRTFQALRIYANGELENLTTVLHSLPEILKPGGRIAIISFHSLEDRIVKKTFQTLAKEETVTILTKKPVEPSREEERENPRSRSAKLRAAIMK